ncbi:hypothetical protein P6F35_gp80 [Sphingomonas phage vB_StuS_MMDA13]|uniref:Uncharacterized protein n=1 Tax=Sphingomonas phage vB_StuS_MMDA13 TaxID=2686378 RepID=A0A7G3PKN1_9CAUD|nr:hypothetical protein P6F35_gp80 [Sphingomonas phage vB_StuS_MMDA13]QHB80513.1 hypothetical protein MMDA13_gp80 [Sphingomonas phage vB_StuS_MMDA13]
MVRNMGEFIGSVEQAAKYGVGPDSRCIARKGEFGAEHAVEHIKVRRNPLTGAMELVIQIAERPNDGH